jgi:hypothetical protein
MASACGTRARTTARPTVIPLNEALPPRHPVQIADNYCAYAKRNEVVSTEPAALQAKVLLNHPEFPNETD